MNAENYLHGFIWLLDVMVADAAEDILYVERIPERLWSEQR